MSAGSQTPFSQLWTNFGGLTAADGINSDEGGEQRLMGNNTFDMSNGITGSGQNLQSLHINGSSISGGNNNGSNINNLGSVGGSRDSALFGPGTGNNSNNNYVNFNQFIMQHNLLGNGAYAGNGGGFCWGNNAPEANNINSGTALSNGFAHNNEEAQTDFLNYAHPIGTKDSQNSESRNNFEPSSSFYDTTGSNSLFSQFNNDSMNSLFSNENAGGGYNQYNNSAATYNYFENVYTPFGNSGGYNMNPFATCFNFSTSNLQASTPEFVPRFKNLTLSDEKSSENNAADSTDNALAVENTKQQLETAGECKSVEQDTSVPKVTDYFAEYANDEAGGGGGDGINIQTGYIFGGNPFKQDIKTTSITEQKASSDSRPEMPECQDSAGGRESDIDKCSNSTNNLFNSPSGASGAMPRYTGTINKQNGSTTNGLRNSATNDSNMMHNYDVQFTNERNANAAEKFEKSSARDRERERDRDQRRFQNGRRSVDYHRSNKRRDDWNRNRDRINGFRVEEKYSNDNVKDSPLPSPEKKLSPKKIYPENEKLSQREKLIRDIEMRRLECLVCVEPIKAHHSIWSCSSCYHVLHLQCIIKWASSSKSEYGWRCPACQNVSKEVPRDYFCFCSKVKNPPYTRQDIAHSCGDPCGRVEGCVHACTLLCHPGPCPPCQANVKRECGCGKTTKLMQCCLKEAIECDSTCGKLLNCELHMCPVKCHDGKCAPCTEKVDQQCHCTKQDRQVACTRDSHDKRTYSCGKPCGKDLTCGNHKCKDCCHAGECRPCKLSPEVVTSCPCGKMPIAKEQRTSCLDTIPVCESVCGKTLRCGKPAHPHHCTSKCHLGNCPPCNKQTAVKCRCGHMDQMIKCRQLSTRADDARCKKRCVKKRSCGKHKCNQECCIDIDHICPLPCNYTLSCGKHKCDQPCHRGNCPPCYRSSFEELYCECGVEVIYPPVPCGTKRPTCKRPCSRTHPCQHPPQHNCHSAASCPPCMIFTTKWCFGQHEQRKTIPCSQESFSCGLACQKPLQCGRHKCIKTCHEGSCQTPGEVCKQSCPKLRATCGHKCMSPCHDGDCPDTPCKEMVEVQCECGNRKQMRLCHDLAREYSRIATAQLASSMAEMQRGNYMELSEILAPVKTHKTNKTLDCNDECRLLERNRRLATGLQSRNPDLPQKLTTKYSDFIRNMAKRNPALVSSIHETLTRLVKLAKESKQKSRSHSFPSMNREKRQLVHEMCEMFGVESVAYDAEPNRNVVATAFKDRSWLPAVSIMEVMQREAGHRRVPVPSNNAWGTRR